MNVLLGFLSLPTLEGNTKHSSLSNIDPFAVF